MTEIKSNGVPQEIKCNELPQETTLTNTLKLIGNSDNQIRQIGVDLLRDYVNNTLQGQIDIIQDYIGNLNDLSTTQKDSLVNAVKEVDNKIDVLNTGISTVQSDITELNSALDTTKSTLNSYISTHKIQKTTVRNYAIGTGLSITPSSNSRLALITPTFGNINSFAYNVQILPVVPNSNTLTIQWLAKNDGTIVRSGNVDLEIMLFPWE